MQKQIWAQQKQHGFYFGSEHRFRLDRGWVGEKCGHTFQSDAFMNLSHMEYWAQVIHVILLIFDERRLNFAEPFEVQKRDEINLPGHG